MRDNKLRFDDIRDLMKKTSVGMNDPITEVAITCFFSTQMLKAIKKHNFFPKQKRSNKDFIGINSFFDKILHRMSINEMRKILIIRLGATFETFFRNSFIKLINEGNCKYKNLKKIEVCKTYQFDLDEIENFIGNKLNIATVISSKLNFNSWKEVNDIFTVLIGRKFEKEIRKFKANTLNPMTQIIEHRRVPNDFVENFNKIKTHRDYNAHRIDFAKKITQKEFNIILEKYKLSLIVINSYFSKLLKDDDVLNIFFLL